MSASEKVKWTKFGEILKSKAGKLYIKVNKGCTLNEGDSVQLQDPRATLKRLVANGVITEEEANAKAAKIMDFYKYDVVLVK